MFQNIDFQQPDIKTIWQSVGGKYIQYFKGKSQKF